ncbi:MAG: lanthionine synthetase C family protein [Myxococcaceae bacterium]
MARSKGWVPVLSGANKRIALQLVSEALDKASKAPARRFSLAGGAAGAALLAAEAGRKALPRKLLSRAMDYVSSHTTPPGLYAGFTGVAFAIECVRAKGDRSVAGSAELDRLLLESVSQPLPADTEVDLISGLAGLGVYSLARKKKALMAGVVERLRDKAENGRAWRTPPRAESSSVVPAEALDLGMAHGTPGILTFLAAAHLRGVDCAELLTASSEWLLSQQSSTPGARFPLSVGSALDATNEKPGRSAWCYGDPGVAFALFVVARALRDRALESQALQLAVDASRRPFSETEIKDTCTCHGTAGLAQLYRRLFHATKLPALGEAADDYLQRTLKRSHRFWSGRGWTHDPSLLTGLTGVALVLLSACTPEAPVWDRMLLLDLPWVLGR